MKFLIGYKTYIGAFGVICTGLGMIAVCVKSGDYSNLQEAFLTIAAGWTAFGFRAAL